MTVAELVILACEQVLDRANCAQVGADQIREAPGALPEFPTRLGQTPGVHVQPQRMKVVRFFASYRGWQIDRVDDEGFQLSPSACAKPISLEAEIYSPGMIGDQGDHRCGAWLWLGRGGETWEMGLWGPWRQVA